MSVHHARKNMKDKNRFSVLLKHLTSMANLKNYALAKSLQYDESYISKWISGKLLPSDKNHELILQAISECIVQSLTPETIPVFLKEYQVRVLPISRPLSMNIWNPNITMSKNCRPRQVLK